MQSMIYGFRFIGLCFSLTKENAQLYKPWLYLMAGNLVLLIVWVIPLAGVVGWLVLNPVGLALIGMIGVFGVVSLVVWGEATALKTCQAFAPLIEEAEARKTQNFPSHITAGRWMDGFLFALARPGWRLIYCFYQLFNLAHQDQLEWLGAHYLILPVISLEEKTLAQAAKRVDQIITDKHLPFRPSFVKVGLIADFIHWFFVAVGLGCGFIVGFSIANPTTAGLLRRVVGMTVGCCVAVILITLGSLFRSFTRACYYTTIYHWVRNIESARHSGEVGQASSPKILKKVLGKTPSGKKER